MQLKQHFSSHVHSGKRTGKEQKSFARWAGIRWKRYTVSAAVLCPGYFSCRSACELVHFMTQFVDCKNREL